MLTIPQGEETPWASYRQHIHYPTTDEEHKILLVTTH